MEVDERLKELADLEIPCEDTDCHNGYIGTRPHVTTPLECPTCKGTGKVSVYSMLRTKCKSFIPPCPHGEDDCPGWRYKSLDEARLCLEELLVAALSGEKGAFVNWLFAVWGGDSLTELRSNYDGYVDSLNER